MTEPDPTIPADVTPVIETIRRQYGKEAADAVKDAFLMGVTMGMAAMTKGSQAAQRVMMDGMFSAPAGDCAVGVATVRQERTPTLAELAAKHDAEEREKNPLAGCYYNTDGSCHVDGK